MFLQCNSLACRLKSHQRLLEVMVQLTCCNGEDLCYSQLCQVISGNYNSHSSLICLIHRLILIHNNKYYYYILKLLSFL